MKTKLFIALTALVTAFAACQKDPDNDTDNSGTTDDYQPTSAGSFWEYNSTTDGVYTETAVQGDTTIEGLKYFKFDNTANGRRYINKNDGAYTSYGYISQIDTTLKLLYLKDAAVGTNWTNTGTYNNIPVTLTSTVASRDIEKTVNGTNFKNVIALNFTISANTILGPINIATGQQFYAKGVGAILSTLRLQVPNTPININDSTYLVSYSIK